jgi:ribosomal protein S27AE
MMTVLDSKRDPDHLIIPFNCGKCLYQNKRAELPMRKVLEDAFTKGGLTCPRCGRVTKSRRKSVERLSALVIGAMA